MALYFMLRMQIAAIAKAMQIVMAWQQRKCGEEEKEVVLQLSVQGEERADASSARHRRDDSVTVKSDAFQNILLVQFV